MGKPAIKSFIAINSKFTRVFLVVMLVSCSSAAIHGETRCEVEAAENLLDSTVKTSTDFNDKNWISQQYVYIYTLYVQVYIFIYIICTSIYIYIFIYLFTCRHVWLVLKRATSNWHKKKESQCCPKWLDPLPKQYRENLWNLQVKYTQQYPIKCHVGKTMS